MSSKISPFLDPGPLTAAGSLAIAHLSRDNVQPVYLQGGDGAVDGYSEGAVINTRFGSFPHSTLIGKPWGSQVRASVVDTGSRGRKRKLDKVAERGDEALESGTEGTTDLRTDRAAKKDVKTAPSGFIHILPPTPELWTSSLPHRTQVVYTPDYSYILHRLRARPSSTIIEAGAGSGSFTHAAARAVYNGYPGSPEDSRGKVWSYEFNEDRYHKMKEEIHGHGLDGIVQITHRDVYNDGFLIDGESPGADCVFLDLPAPWKALPHLSRGKPTASLLAAGGLDPLADKETAWKSPLRADRSIHLCTFSPCIEQVTKTVEIMRRLGWMEIEMVEVANRRIYTTREKFGLGASDTRGAGHTAANVMEAVARLKEVNSRRDDFDGRRQNRKAAIDDDDDEEMADEAETFTNGDDTIETEGDLASIKPWMSGNPVHRTEPEIKTHTSYLVFAILPREWTEEQETAAFEALPCGKETKVIGNLDKAARKQEKRELLLQKTIERQKRKAAANKTGDDSVPISKKNKTS